MIDLKIKIEVFELFIIKLSSIVSNENLRYAKPIDYKLQKKKLLAVMMAKASTFTHLLK